jgi:hypothetical protein
VFALARTLAVTLVAALSGVAVAQTSTPDPTSPFLPIQVLAETIFPNTGNR